METSEYLVAEVGGFRFGVYCRDTLNVYTQKMKLTKMFYQESIFRGLVQINGQVMQVIDLRRRIGLTSADQQDLLTIITFQTEMEKSIAVVVDRIVGMKTIAHDQIKSQCKHLNNNQRNINLLFPMIAVMNDGGMVQLLDTTYLDKLEPIQEEAGDLEFF